MISIPRPGGVLRIARNTLWESSMSMWRMSGNPSSEIVSCRWINVITVASRLCAIDASILRRVAASHCFWNSGASELRMR
jgi:hypothetical protein